MDVRLTPRGSIFLALTLALLMLANIIQSYILLIFVAILSFYFVSYVVYLRILEKPQVNLQVKTRHGILFRGELEVLHLEIQNLSNSDLPSVKIAIDFPGGIFPVNQSNEISISIPPKRTSIINIPLLPLERGLFEIGPITVSQNDVFDLFATPLAKVTEVPVRVYPKRIKAHVNQLKVQEVFSKLIDIYSIRRKGMGSDFHGLREYIRGDPSKIVYWPAVAKHGKLISKEYEDEKQLEVIVVMQGGTTMRGQKFDFVLGTAMDIYSGVLEQGHPTGFLFFDDDVHLYFKPSQSRKQQLRIWGELYSAKAKDTYVNFPNLARRLEREKITNKLFIFIGDLEYKIKEFLNLVRRIVMMKNSLIFIDVHGSEFSISKRIDDVAKTYAGDEYGQILREIIGNHIQYDEVFRGVYIKQELKRFNAVYAYIHDERETVVEALDRALRTIRR